MYIYNALFQNACWLGSLIELNSKCILEYPIYSNILDIRVSESYLYISIEFG